MSVACHLRRALLGLLLPLGAGTVAAQPVAGPPVAAQPVAATNELMVLGEPGARLSLDGRPVGVLPLTTPLLVSPGSHQLAVDSGPRKLQATIEVRPGSFVDVRFDQESGAAMVSQPPTALVSESYSGGEPADPQLLQRAAQSAMEQEGLHRRSPPAAPDGSPPASCSSDAACQLRSAEQAQIPYVLLLSAQRQGSDWKLGCSLGHSKVGELSASEQASCPGCSGSQAASELMQLSRRVIAQGLARPQGRLVVHSQPPGAVVTWNGRRLGETPLEQPLFTGLGLLEVGRPGFRSERRQLPLTDGAPLRVDLELRAEAVAVEVEPEPALLNPLLNRPPTPQRPVVERERRPTWRLLSGGTALAAGGLLVGFGVGGLMVDGSCIDAVSAPAQRCDQLYATHGLGTGLTVSGALLLAGGTVLLAIPGRPRAQSVAQLLLGRSGPAAARVSATSR